jgi:hypothetical protein
MKKSLLNIFIIFVILACNKTDDSDNPIIAMVGKTVLYETDIEKLQLEIGNDTYSKSDVVADWVNRELLFTAAIESGIDKDESLVSKLEQYRKDLIGKTFLNNYAEADISVENSEIRRYYDSNREMFRHKHDGAKIMHFFTNVDSVATFIFKTLTNSDESVDRKALLSNYQVDVSTVEKGNLVDELDEALFLTSRSSNIIGPIQTEYGFHVIEVLGRYSAESQIDIDEAFDEIYQILYNQKKELRTVAFMDSLRNRYNIKIYLEKN